MVKGRRKIKYQKKAQNRFSMALATTVMVAIVAGVVVKGFQLRTQLQEYEKTKASLQEQIDAEESRTQELEEYSKYTQTDEYVEKVAREKLGLVKKGEIIFRNTGEAADTSGTGGAAAGGDNSTSAAAATGETTETTGTSDSEDTAAAAEAENTTEAENVTEAEATGGTAAGTESGAEENPAGTSAAQGQE